MTFDLFKRGITSQLMTVEPDEKIFEELGETTPEDRPDIISIVMDAIVFGVIKIGTIDSGSTWIFTRYQRGGRRWRDRRKNRGAIPVNAPGF
jgi:hypothetical protein